MCGSGRLGGPPSCVVVDSDFQSQDVAQKADEYLQLTQAWDGGRLALVCHLMGSFPA